MRLNVESVVLSTSSGINMLTVCQLADLSPLTQKALFYWIAIKIWKYLGGGQVLYHLEQELFVALTFHDHARNIPVRMMITKIPQCSYSMLVCFSQFLETFVHDFRHHVLYVSKDPRDEDFEPMKQQGMIKH